MKNSKKMIEIIEKKKELSEEKTPKYGTRKLSIGLVSCMLGFSLIIAPCSSKAIELKESPEAAASEKNIPETPVVDETKPAETPKEETATPVENPTETTPAVEKKVETKQADTFKANLQTITVDQGKNVEDYKKAITNLPQDAKLDVTTPADTKEAGEKAVKATITFSDGSTKEVEIKVNVNPVEKTEEKNTENSLEVSPEEEKTGVTAPNEGVDAISSATYYNKANWENKIKDKSRWPIGDKQRLVRVSTSDPLEMNDVNYDGAFIDANGRTVLRLIYREKAAATSGVWYRALFNFGELDQYVDYDKSYVVGRDGETKYDLKPFNDRKERLLDIGRATGDRTNQRKNLPINLVLNEGLRTKDLGDRNYIVQMRITNGDDATKIYAYAPGKSSMDYSSYTKSTSVSLSDKVDSLFVKGGQQSDSENATNQEFFMSEYIANPDEYADTTNIGIIRTQYKGQRKGTADSPTVGGEPIAFVQVFDAKLVPFLKEEADGTIAYTNLLNEDRTVSKFANKVKIKKTDINYSKDGKLAYVVLAPKAFQKDGVNKVEISKHDQYTMLQGFYFTAIDYLVDKTKFADNFVGTNKLDYSMMSGWMNPNINGWTVFEKEYENDYRVPEGESYLIDVGTKPASNQIMVQIGDETRAIYRKPQGYYNGYVTGKNGIDQIDEFAKGVYKFTLREGATIEKGQKIRILVPYVGDHPDTVNFLEANDGTDYNKGSAQLRLQKDRNINMHLYTDLPGGATFKLRYTLKGQTEEKELVFTKPNLAGGLWKYNDSDKVLTGIPNRSSTSTGGNFYIDTTKLEKGKDIFVDAYDEKGNKLEDKTSYFRYSKVNKVSVYNDMTWVDHTDTSSILSINKSLYTPYQLIFTNDYAEGTDDFYKDPRAFTGTNENFMKDTTSFVGYTKYDGGKVRTLYEEGRVGKLYAKVEAAADEYTDKGEIKTDNSKKITIPKSDIFDAQFEGDNKEYRAYEYTVNLREMLLYHSEDKTPKPLTLLKDMKFVSTASDGSSLPSDLYETRVRARVLFDANTGKLTEGGKQVDRVVKIAPDNVKFYGQEGYKANGFEGANVEANTGDKFPGAPTLAGKNFLGWVTEAGKKVLGDNAVVTADAFGKLSKDQIFTNETPVTKHLVVYAIYSEDVAVTFDANEGKFADGKDTTTVEAESGSVTKPADPTREGYTFKGWAASKDATEADANILNNVTAAKTVYAVWEKKADAELTLKNPKKTPVGDLNALTSGEKDAVIAAIIKANPDAKLTAADIKVENDGKAIVSKDGKTKEFKPEETVEQKEVQNNFNPPKEPVLVDNTSTLTPKEKQAVKDAVKKANPDRNFTDDDITVADDGTVKINQDGKVGTIPADKTVKAKDSVLTLVDPDVTEVKDINNLTEEEKDAVKKAVIAKNSGLTENDITVDSKGNVSVKTSDGKTGEIPASKTVKEKDLSKLKKPTVTPVANDKNLTENEKQAVKDAIKAANKDYDLQDNEITVDENGKATVTRGKSSKEFAPADTVKKDAKLLDVKEPKKTEVADINKLTEPEQEAVEQAIIDANPDLKLTKEEVVINDDGSAVITRGDKKYALAQKDNVVEKLKYPEITEVANPAKLTENEKADVERAVRKANPNLPEGTTVVVGNDGTVTVTYPTSDGRSPATIPAKNTVVKNNTKDKTAPAAPTVEAKDDGSVTVTPPKDVDVKSMDITYTPEGSDTPVTVKATKDDYGNWSLPADSGLKIDPASGVVTIPADKVKDGTEVSAKAKDEAGNASTAGTAKTPTTADKTEPVVPAKTPVADKTNLTDDEKAAVKKAIEDANKDKLPAGTTVEVGKDGTATITYPDKSTDTIKGSDLVEAKTPTTADQ
ncbi:Rib/alpha-like domain-containing protein, partial [Anaerococcus jeddahensis]|uniref:Rib/alpha-like domain-containing protein n=1 Tax=Anaerococcus jeddahensis TaxID=1673719 RepID=UPI00069DE9C0